MCEIFPIPLMGCILARPPPKRGGGVHPNPSPVPALDRIASLARLQMDQNHFSQSKHYPDFTLKGYVAFYSMFVTFRSAKQLVPRILPPFRRSGIVTSSALDKPPRRSFSSTSSKMTIAASLNVLGNVMEIIANMACAQRQWARSARLPPWHTTLSSAGNSWKRLPGKVQRCGSGSLSPSLLNYT